MTEKIEARVAGEFIHAGDGQRYGDGETCMVSEATLERHPTVLERVDDSAAGDDEGNPGDDSSTDESPGGSNNTMEPLPDEMVSDLTELDGVGEATADALREAGFETVADVRDADPDSLAEVDRISEDHADELTSE